MWHKKKTRKLARRSTGVVHSFVKLVAKKENDEKIEFRELELLVLFNIKFSLIYSFYIGIFCGL